MRQPPTTPTLSGKPMKGTFRYPARLRRNRIPASTRSNLRVRFRNPADRFEAGLQLQALSANGHRTRRWCQSRSVRNGKSGWDLHRTARESIEGWILSVCNRDGDTDLKSEGRVADCIFDASASECRFLKDRAAGCGSSWAGHRGRGLRKRFAGFSRAGPHRSSSDEQT